MAIDPEVMSWLKVIAGSGATGSVLMGAFHWFIRRPLLKAEAEALQYKNLWKGEQLAREKRIADAETALYGRPSMRFREEQPTLSMIVDSRTKKEHEAELQRQMLAERARGLPHTTALEAFAPSPRDQVRAAGGGQDVYEERRQRQRERGEDTPTAFQPIAIAEPFPHYAGKPDDDEP
ncbi:MAG TPA: hypothetical protein VH062_02075 [Polyangiaceae bacterium]|jgi:hypothetical protein|nr:hypothetical protein [Polyangiaceae bacterium]